MGRLIVDACSAQNLSGGPYVKAWSIGVSVSRADTGMPVTHLDTKNFIITALNARFHDFEVSKVEEFEWEPLDLVRSGMYRVSIRFAKPDEGKLLELGERYVFGIAVRTWDQNGPEDHGQTVIDLIYVDD